MTSEVNELIYVSWSEASSDWADAIIEAGHVDTKLALYRIAVAYAIRESENESVDVPTFDNSIFDRDFAWGDLDPDGTFEGMLRILCPKQKELHKHSQHLAEFGVRRLKEKFSDPNEFDIASIFKSPQEE